MYVVLQVSTKYAFNCIVGLIQSYLTEMNMFVKEKEMPSLNTRTRLAIIGTTADWCPVSLWKTLHKDLEHHVENLQTSDLMDAKFCHHGVSAFLLWKNKMRMPKMNSLMSKQDVEFIDYYERLLQCIVFELADEDWDWFKLIMNDYVVNGHLKQVVSQQASILELPHGPQSNFMMVRFLKSIKLQMSFVHYFRTIDCNGVQSLDYMIHVEVEQGKDRPYKNTNLQREVLSIPLPPTQAGGQVLGNRLIWYLRALPGDNCIFCTRPLKLMSSSCCILLNVYVLIYTSISIKRSPSHTGAVRQSLVPGLKPRRDLEQWTVAGIWPRTEPTSSVSSPPSLPTRYGQVGCC
jgi:hypothetical protein